ncbi:hypothetical protein NPX13_g7842 [Xylaria arbuscula]|uniref:Uncharacterized protein n=1 Tax=Xylaria arbuscula TaxID=114810 RepID=A0A9W8N9K2_9PEZI|nr:hypothetical protein NPX13_g7842 [Xylaria arbuscula]
MKPTSHVSKSHSSAEQIFEVGDQFPSSLPTLLSILSFFSAFPAPGTLGLRTLVAQVLLTNKRAHKMIYFIAQLLSESALEHSLQFVNTAHRPVIGPSASQEPDKNGALISCKHKKHVSTFPGLIAPVNATAMLGKKERENGVNEVLAIISAQKGSA